MYISLCTELNVTFSGERGAGRHVLTMDRADIEVKGGEQNKRNSLSLRDSLAEKATIWKSCSWIQV